jgi:hypothetical protein
MKPEGPEEELVVLDALEAKVWVDEGNVFSINLV